MKRFAAIIGLCIALAAGITFAVLTQSAMSSLRHDNTSLRTQVSSLSQQLATDTGKLSKLANKMADLNVPTDPLSAYNQICISQNTNNQTGVDQSYYYPCTNQAQTIPLPGG